MGKADAEAAVVVRFGMAKRPKYQRPRVHAVGTRDPVWRIQYREYFTRADGVEDFHHRTHSWSQETFTKKQAQVCADKMLQELQAGPPKADGSMILRTFWDTIYLPIRQRRWTGSTYSCVTNLYKNHIAPVFGPVALKEITKAAIEIHLGKLADAQFGFDTVDGVRIRLHSILLEAYDNDFVLRNVCHKVLTPACKPKGEMRSLTEAEVNLLWDGTTGRDYLIWRLLILTGARIGEIFPLERSDIQPDCLMIDEAMVRGKVKLPKRNKVRKADLADSLRGELEEWLTSHSNRLIFPSPTGKVYQRSRDEIQAILDRGRAVGIPDLTFRMCRTTFASLYLGDEADRSSIMGHTSTAFTLERYRKPIMERRHNSIEELDRRLKVVRIDKKRQA
jgi:integrase